LAAETRGDFLKIRSTAKDPEIPREPPVTKSTGH